MVPQTAELGGRLFELVAHAGQLGAQLGRLCVHLVGLLLGVGLGLGQLAFEPIAVGLDLVELGPVLRLLEVELGAMLLGLRLQRLGLGSVGVLLRLCHAALELGLGVLLGLDRIRAERLDLALELLDARGLLGGLGTGLFEGLGLLLRHLRCALELAGELFDLGL